MNGYGNSDRKRISGYALCLFLAFFLMCSTSAASARRSDPRLDWREMVTPRFRVVFPASLRDIAQKTARIAEETLPLLETFLGTQIPYRPVIVVRDESDLPVGYADLLYGEIQFMVAEPFDLTFGNHFESWITLVLVHELVHLVHLGAVGPDVEKIRQVLGYVALPNMLQPIWVWEGYAMYGESLFSNGNRNGNPVYEMYLRDMALREAFVPRHLLAGYSFLDAWPGRMGVYLYGASIIRYVAEHYGHDALAALSHERSQSLDPAGFGKAFERALGKTVDEVWQEWQDTLRRSAEEVVLRIEQEPLTSYRWLTEKGFYSRNAVLSPDGRNLVYSLIHPRYLPGLRLVDLRNGKERLLVHGIIGGRPSFSADSRFLVYAKVASDLFTEWYDLYLYDFEKGRESRLSHRERAFSPAFQNGAILYLRRNRMPEALLKLSLQTGETEVLYEFSADFRPLHLAVHSREKNIAVTGRWRGRLVIALFDLYTRRWQWVTTATFPDPVPSFSPDGRFLIFSDAWDGIFNVYAFELAKGRFFRLTNLIGGAFEPVLTADVGYASFFGEGGYNIGIFPNDPDTWEEVVWPVCVPPDDRLWSRFADGALYPERPYRSLTGLAPRYWIPAGNGISLSGRDPLNFHSYTLIFEFLGDRPTGSLRYRGTFVLPELALDLSFEGDRMEWGAGISVPFTAEEAGRGNLGISYRRVWKDDPLYEGFWTGVVATADWSTSGGDDRWIENAEWALTARWGEREGTRENDLIFSWRSARLRAGNPLLRFTAELVLGVSDLAGFYALGGRTGLWGISGYPEETLRGALAGKLRVAGTFPLVTIDAPLFEMGAVKGITGTLYLEGGAAGERWSALESRFAAGGEITLRSYLAEELPLNLTIGYVFPLDRDLPGEWYLDAGIRFH
ncbi:MAG TPA: hypothetical protein VLH40_01300 [Atribacteraceae bacterium]|nr:hypothetical protein [Atribacteraceae bacterium]